MIERLIRLNMVYLVTQTYSRADTTKDAGTKIHLLLTGYESLELARKHRLVLKDKFAAIIQLNLPAHRAKLQSMLYTNSPYRLWFAIIKNKWVVEKQINHRFKDPLLRYIKSKTNWRVGYDDQLRPQLVCIFGELYVHLEHGSKKLEIRLSNLEKC
ncbi:MAG: hypothetical protein PHD73_03155 [Sediminibacterium sp.]|nr:hypothetical protein [Sediminibacterium sp.]